jgi:hypothetical protein
MFKKARIAILIFILLLVAAVQWKQQARLIDWQEPVWVTIYPIAADQSPNTADYIQSLNVEQLAAIERFFQQEADHFGIALKQPVKVTLGLPIRQLPPVPPLNGALLEVMLWSLQLRYWAWSNENSALAGDISLFVLYHDPALLPSLPHSLGLERGHVGLIHAFATNAMSHSNSVVISHELLHTLGASDKYDLQTDQPLYPEGYAEPELEPLYPQRLAEIMGGRIPISAMQANTPEHLNEALIGDLTAQEIGWKFLN